jgi:TetR/AcrR family transcriptional regulator, regulator of autoinduction and epiphytic fitness
MAEVSRRGAPTPTIEAPARVDGRTARAERTRRAIVDAHLELLGEGDLKPTGERIAERAGVSLRALWTNFKDMERLFAATGQRLMERQEAEFRPVPTDLPLERRVEEFCRQRARLLELIGPAAKAARIREPFSAQLRRNRSWYISRVREEIATLFAGELVRAGAEREELLNALIVAATSTSWALLRDEMALDVDGARRVMQRMVLRLLRDL